MTVVHKITAGTYASLTIFLGGSVSGKPFPKDIIVAYAQPSYCVRLKAEILRQIAQHGMGMQNIAFAHFDIRLDYSVSAHLAVRPYNNVIFNYGKRPYGDIVPQYYILCDISGRVNVLRHLDYPLG
jgi:hypothetical protein